MKNYLLLMFALTTMNLFSENKRITLYFIDSTKNTMYLETIDLSSETNNERFLKSCKIGFGFFNNRSLFVSELKSIVSKHMVFCVESIK